MDEKQKMNGSEFVNHMAELGQKHAEIISNALQQVASEVEAETNDEKLKKLHPIFISAGKGAYHGAMRMMMQKDNPLFKVISMRLEED